MQYAGNSAYTVCSINTKFNIALHLAMQPRPINLLIFLFYAYSHFFSFMFRIRFRSSLHFLFLHESEHTMVHLWCT